MEKQNSNSLQQYLFLFADLIKSTEIARASEGDHSKYMGSFHWAVNRAKCFIQTNFVFPQSHFRRIIQNISVNGDEVFSYTIIDKSASELEKEDLVASSVAFIFMMQLYWLASPFNLERMRADQPPMKISAGLHIGRGYDVPTEYSNVLASLNIHTTKRLEDSAKKGKKSNIYATHIISDYFNSWKQHIKEDLPLKLRPPLSYACFHKFKRNPAVKGIDTSLLTIFELGLDLSEKKELNDLIAEIYMKKNDQTYQAETAGMIMSTNFLICNGNPFRYNNGKPAIPDYKFRSALHYIKNWFDAYNNTNFDIKNAFMALNYLIITGAFIRHPEVTQCSKPFLEICIKKYSTYQSKFKWLKLE